MYMREYLSTNLFVTRRIRKRKFEEEVKQYQPKVIEWDDRTLYVFKVEGRQRVFAVMK